MKTDKLAEDLIDKYLRDFYWPYWSKTNTIKAMQEYHKSKMAEITDEQIQEYVTKKFSNTKLLPEIIAFRAIKAYIAGFPPISNNEARLDY